MSAEATNAMADAWKGKHNPVRNFWDVYQSSKKVMMAMRKHNMSSLAQVFDAVFTPDNFQHMKGSDISKLKRSSNSEYWVQGPCLFIDVYKGGKFVLNKLYQQMQDELDINMHQLTSE
jgi:hypothetical protein